MKEDTVHNYAGARGVSWSQETRTCGHLSYVLPLFSFTLHLILSLLLSPSQVFSVLGGSRLGSFSW